MLIDDTHQEETRVVVVDGNKLEDVEFESSTRKQIKSNIYLGKIMRVEPSLQACFVDYGGNRHGFMAFGEIHPDYYNISEEELNAIDKEVDEIIENKKRIAKEMEAQREARARERALARELALRQENENKSDEEDNTSAIEDNTIVENKETTNANVENTSEKTEEFDKIAEEEFIAQEEAKEEESGKKHTKKRLLKKKFRKQIKSSQTSDDKVLAESADDDELKVFDDNTKEDDEIDDAMESSIDADADVDADADTDTDTDIDEDTDFELQRKLIRARKLYHSHKIQDVIKEGQIVLVQVVKEERGNKGAAMTTYLSLAGRYCVLMPNRIKSGGVSRKITNAADRTRLKNIVKELPLNGNMSIIVRTAGEEKPKSEIVRDYNFLIRIWNQIRTDAIKMQAPTLIHEEGSLIKRALRDIYSKEINEILIAGDEAYKQARSYFKMLSPSNLKKVKHYNNDDVPLFQRFQVEGQLDKLHDTTAQLESGGYLVINPTEALVSIDVNSGRATKEKDLEETALKTNLEACDEIARQLKLRNLAGLVVIDFIDMDEPANNHAVEKKMKEALKKDRSRIQVGKMSIFGLLELSRQRVHSAFWESNYRTCPYCHGKGITRTLESAAVYILRMAEEEGSKLRSSKISIYVPSDIAVHLLNHKREALVAIENKYKMNIIICADDEIKCVTDYRLERIKIQDKPAKNSISSKNDIPDEVEIIENNETINETNKIEKVMQINCDEVIDKNINDNKNDKKEYRGRRGRFERRGNRRRNNFENENKNSVHSEPVILYDSHKTEEHSEQQETVEVSEEKKEKSNWWKKLIKG